LLVLLLLLLVVCCWFAWLGQHLSLAIMHLQAARSTCASAQDHPTADSKQHHNHGIKAAQKQSQ
jgi:hypothetical protein